MTLTRACSRATGQVRRTIPLGSERGLFDRGLGGVGFRQHGFAVGVVVLADLSHQEVARRALDQPYAEALFQHGDAPAEFGLGFTQGATGGSKAAVINHLHEVVEVVEVAHDPSSFFQWNGEFTKCRLLVPASRRYVPTV